VTREIFHHEIADDRATALSLELPEKAKFALYQHLTLTKESILALLHTHPFDWVDLSPIDQANQISSRVGFWSIVLPHYARTPWSTRTAGFHILDHNGWVRLTEAEVVAAITVTAS
jgi:proteasome lid subunit RPN8/RPN11